MIIVLLIIAGFIAYRALLAFVSPTRPCGKCGGGGLKSIKKLKFCGRCHGSGRVPRLGAQLINRGATQSLRQYQDRGNR